VRETGTLGSVHHSKKEIMSPTHTTHENDGGETPPTGADLHYRTALDAGRFLIQKCTACAKAVFYPRMICPHCGDNHLEWMEPSGLGSVYSTTVVRRKPEAGGDYNVALVDLAEGVRLMTRIEGMAPTDVKIGLAVKARVDQQDGRGILLFTATGDKK
jgi:uncharacterized OB-fold protein